MTDYHKGKIYQIKHTMNDDIYIGSTCASLATRMTKHRYDGKHQKGHVLFDLIAEHGVDKFYIEIIEEYPCNTKQELLAREGYYIRERGTINKRIAGRSYKQYYEEHKEHYVEANKKRYENNKYAIQAQHKEYAERNKEHLAQKKQRVLCT